MTYRAYKYRICPDEAQAGQLARTFGCVRFVYNKCLEEEERRHAAGGPFAGRTALNNWCNRSLKDEFPFLRDVDKFALTNAAWALAGAYERMFDGTARHPRFKSRRRSRRSYTTNLTGSNIAVLDGCIKLPRIGKVKAVIHRRAPEGHVLKSATVSMERDGTYYCSVLYEYGEAAASVPSPEQNAVGLDYKSDGLYVSSDGEVCGSPKYYRKAQKRLARAQRVLSRRKGPRKGETESNNHRRQKRRVAKLHRHVANQRKDFLHKQSTAIAKRYSLVCVEDLDMRALSNKGFGIGRAVMDNGYGMFLDMLDYKLRDRGGALVRVDRWFPSSQLCGACGRREPSVKDLSVRTWTCPACGAVHDRDVNAAVNILREGIRSYKAVTA